MEEVTEAVLAACHFHSRHLPTLDILLRKSLDPDRFYEAKSGTPPRVRGCSLARYGRYRSFILWMQESVVSSA